MSYLNTSMTKRASLAATLGILGAAGAAAGGLAGYYGSDKTNNTPATALGAIGGGIGAPAGAYAAGISSKPFGDKIFRTDIKLDDAAYLGRYLDAVAEGKAELLPPERPPHILIRQKASLERQLAKTPKLIKYIAKRPGLYYALGLGIPLLGAAAGGAAGATLGVKGGDALA
jgi:hypothetical protein